MQQAAVGVVVKTEESAWLRECVFALQGVSRERIQFFSEEKDEQQPIVVVEKCWGIKHHV